jgi:hypothetical protein
VSGATFLSVLGRVATAEQDRTGLANDTVTCIERLAAEGADRAGYTSAQMARDVDVLRALLGYET